MKKKNNKPPKRTKMLRLTARRREAMEELVKFIDAHGGKLGAFRGYGAAQQPGEQVTPPSSSS